MLESELKVLDGEVRNMRKICLLIFITICLLGFMGGCKLINNVVSDWDVSACDSNWDVCG